MNLYECFRSSKLRSIPKVYQILCFFYSKVESKRGDVAKSIQCYMVHEGISEVEARHRIKELINHSWKKLNEESAKNSLPNKDDTKHGTNFSMHLLVWRWY